MNELDVTSAPRGPARASRRRIGVLAALWAAVALAVLLVPGCYGNNCEGSFEVFGDDPGEGKMLDEDTWISGDQDGVWLWFPRQRYYVFDLRALGGRMPTKPLAYISGTREPSKFGGNMTLAGGNLAQFYAMRPNGIDVKNESCSDYYLHLVVEATPFPPEAPMEDGGAPGADDAGDDDASTGDDDAAGDETSNDDANP